MRTQQWLDFCVGSGRALKRPFSSSKTSFKVVPGSKQHVLQLFGSTPTATPKKQEHVLAVLRSGLRWVKSATFCECRAKKLRGKNTANLSTLLITILFALSVRPHKALPPTSPKGMLVAIIRSNSCSLRWRVIRLCRFLVIHSIDVK